VSPQNSFSTYRQQYPDPFLDIASTKLPKSQKKLLELLYLFATTHPQISPIVKKLAKYPITNIIVNSPSNHKSLEAKWKHILEDELNIYETAEAMGLDYMGYGNCFITIHKPFVRSYRCKSCKVDQPAGRLNYYIIGAKFYADCPGCKKRSEFEGRDNPITAVEEIAIVRIPPQEMHIRYNSLTGKSEYYRQVPAELKKAVNNNKPDRAFIDSTPWVYVRAAINKKKIKFAKGKILHLKEPTLSGRRMHWGLPIIMAALKDAYLNQVYKKADETVANERTVPARFVFPQATSNDPFRTISLSKFSNFIGRSIRRFRHDKNALMPVPFPVGVAEIGGDAQRLFTANLRELTIKEIIGSTGVPEGFLGDGMTWSGGSVQLRMLENMMMSYLRALNKLLRFVVKETSKITEIPEADVRFKPFRMADDVQMLAMLMQLAQMKHVSFKEILDRMDLDWEEQHEIVNNETEKIQNLMVKEALTEAKAGLEAVKWQISQQSRAESTTHMVEELNQHAAAAKGHLEGDAPYEAVEQQQEEQEQQQAEAEQAQAELEGRAQEAEVAKTEASAEQKDTKTDLAQEQFQVAPVVEGLVQQLLTMKPDLRTKKIERLHESAPIIAQKVEERLSELVGQESPNSAGRDILTELRLNSASPKEMAERITMLPKELKAQALQQLLDEDPMLATMVSEAMGINRGRGKAKLSGPDTRPNPEVKPPRRK